MQDHYTFVCEASDLAAHPRHAEIKGGYGRFSERRIPRLETWDRSDFFVLNNFVLFDGEFYCTRAFLELARAQNWSGFAFHPLDALGESWTDFRKRPWPPSRWYPDGQPD